MASRLGPDLRRAGQGQSPWSPRARRCLLALSGHSRGRPSLRRSFPKPALRGYVQHHLPAQSQQRGTFLPFDVPHVLLSVYGYARTVAPQPDARYGDKWTVNSLPLVNGTAQEVGIRAGHNVNYRRKP